MLRHTTHGLNHGRGKGWLITEADRRLNKLGVERYCHRLDEWFVFPAEVPVRLNPPGSDMLRLLVSYGALVPATLPILVRLKSVNWSSRDAANKVLQAVAWVEQWKN